MKVVYIFFLSLFPVFIGGVHANDDYPSYALSTPYFIENKGQIAGVDGLPRADVLYYCGNSGVKAYFHKGGIYYVFSGRDSRLLGKDNDERISNRQTNLALHRTSLTFTGSNPNPVIKALEASPSKYNYYYPHSPNGVIGVRAYRKIIYENIYDNIDLYFTASLDGSGFKYDFIVKPGGDVSDIRMEYSQDTKLFLNANGSLILNNSLGTIEEYEPYSYHYNSKINTSFFSLRMDVISKFNLYGNVVSFEVSDYNKSETLVIDPHINWSTYFGGEDGDHSRSVAIDKVQDIVITGYTLSDNFPVTDGAFQTERADTGYDSFIAKFDAFGQLLWATYFGGDLTDLGHGVCVDDAMNVYVAGFTWSNNFPVSSDAFQRNFGGGDNPDGYIAKFDPDGERLWATYYGGSNADHFYSIAKSNYDEIAVTGWTESVNFPRSSYSPDMNIPSSFSDACVVRMTTSGSFISGYLFGGTRDDLGQHLDYDSFNNILITGFTESSDFPITPNDPGDRRVVEKKDIFAVRFSNADTLTQIDYCYIYGGSENDEAYSLALDKDANIYITGTTASMNYPATSGVFQRNKKGGQDVFVTKLNRFGKLMWSTYFGGFNYDIAYDIGVDPFLNIIITGETQSPDLPLTRGTLHENLKGTSDAFAAKLNATGAGFFWSTYIGGSFSDIAYSIALDMNENSVITGSTESTDFPVVFNPEQDKNAGRFDAFLLKLCSNEPYPKINITGSTIFCPGDSAILDAGSEWRWYRWNDGSTTRRLTVKKEGIYYVQVTDTNGCVGISDTIKISLYKPEKPKFTGEPGFCKGDSTTIGVVQDYVSYTWSNGKKTKNISVNKEGWYAVTVTDKNGCRQRDSVRVVQYADPKPIIRGQTVVCEGSRDVFYWLIGNASERYTWSVEGGTFEYGFDTVNIYVDWGASGLGRVFVKALNYITGCIGYDTMVVTISDHLEPEITSNKNDTFDICEGDSLRLDAGIGFNSYLWNTGAVSRLITVKETGEYWVYIKDAIGCEGRDTVDVRVYQNPKPRITGKDTICEFADNIIYQTPGVSGNSYTWTITGGIINTGENSNSINVSWGKAGEGFLILREKSDTSGCETTVSLNIIINKTPEPVILITGDTALCEGDSTMLIAEGGSFRFYQWSNGARTRSIWVKQSGIYYVAVSDDNGCVGYSKDSVIINVHPNPEKPVITRIGDTLYTNNYDYEQWYLNGSEVPGATARSLFPPDNGIYAVIVKNIYGCEDVSEPYDYWRGEGFITIAVPDTIFAETEKIIKVPITITGSQNLRKVKAENYELFLSFNKTVLLPEKNNLVIADVNNIKQLKLEGLLVDTLGLLTELVFHTGWGDSECSLIMLDSMKFNVPNVRATLRSGVFCLTNLCKAGGTRLFIDDGSELVLRQNQPNPFSDITEIEFSIIEEAPTKLYIIDLMGRTVSTIFDETARKGTYKIIFEGSTLPQGIYTYILQTPTMVLTRRMEAVR